MPRIPILVFFIALVVSFIALADLVIYEVIAATFALGAGASMAIGAALGALSLSFIVATIIGMRWYNRFTRWYYSLSALWMGFFAYAFFACALYGLIVAVLGALLPSVAMLCMLAALCASAYGFVHARTIAVKNVAVKLPARPQDWRGVRAVWTSDLHLGQLHGPRFARMVADRIRSIPHDILFVGGDLYDGTGAPDSAELIAPLKDLHPRLGKYFITGNHEEFGDAEHFLAAVRMAGFRILMNESIDIRGVTLIGADYRGCARREDFRRFLERLRLDKNKPSILLKHEPKDLDLASEAGISLQISGHTHRAQMWPLMYVAQLVYKGFAYGLRTLGAMQVFVSSGTGTWGPPMRVGSESEIVAITFE